MIVPSLFALAQSLITNRLSPTAIAQPEHYWVHWHYPEQYWLEFAENEWAQAKRDTFRLVVIAILCFPLVTAVCAVAGPYLDYNLTAAFLMALSVMAGVLLLAWATYLTGYRLYQRRRIQPGEVYIGYQGMVTSDGQTLKFKDRYERITLSVYLEEKNLPILCFESRITFLRATNSRGSRINWAIARILVPPHSLDQAHHVMNKLMHAAAI